MNAIQTFLDKAAVSLSLLCIAHCLLLPVAVSIIPVFAVLPLEDEFFHTLLLILVLPTSCIGLTLGCKKHQRWKLALWGAVGLSIIVLAAFFGHDTVGEFGEKVLTLLGSIIIAWGHFQNYRLCRSDRCH